MKGRICVVVSVFMFISIIAGCGATVKKIPTTKIALVTAFGGPNDLARNESAYAGIKMLEGDAANKISAKMFELDAADSNAEYLIRLLAVSDYSIVFVVGNPLGESISRLAATYPDKRFVCLDSSGYSNSAVNLQYAGFDVNQAALAAGVLAGITAKKGQIGFMDTSNKTGRSIYLKGFMTGVQSVNRLAQVAVLEKGVSDNLPKEAGLEVLFVNGTFADQYDVLKKAPAGTDIITCGAYPLPRLGKELSSRLLATVRKNTAAVEQQIVREMLSGKFVHGTAVYGLNEGMDIVPVEGRLSKEQQNRFIKYCAEITAGNIK